MTPEQRRAKQARDKRYRANNKEAINRRARERYAARKTAAGREAELLALYKDAGAPWLYSGGQAAFLRDVEIAKEAGATHMDIVRRLKKQGALFRKYRVSSNDADESDEFWADRDDRFDPEEWYFYHGYFG